MRLAAASVALVFSLSGATEPAPIRGTPLTERTNLHLLVADAPPFVLDVDAGSIRPIRATPDMRRGLVGVQDLRAAGAVIETGGFNRRIYVLRSASARPLFIGVARTVVPSDDGQSLWIKTAVTSSNCTLRRVGLDGHPIGDLQRLRCSAEIGPGGVTPRSGIVAAAGDELVLAGPEKSFTLLDSATGAERVYQWPSRLYGLDEPKIDTRDHLVALAFADPAWNGGPDQATDVWTLDTQTGALAQVPGMPALVDLKFTSMEWTRDGRLVWLAERTGKAVVAVWRPGDAQLQVKRVRIPRRTSGTDAFAILPAG
jgi:hypothetical protein